MLLFLTFFLTWCFSSFLFRSCSLFTKVHYQPSTFTKQVSSTRWYLIMDCVFSLFLQYQILSSYQLFSLKPERYLQISFMLFITLKILNLKHWIVNCSKQPAVSVASYHYVLYLHFSRHFFMFSVSFCLRTFSGTLLWQHSPARILFVSNTFIFICTDPWTAVFYYQLLSVKNFFF